MPAAAGGQTSIGAPHELWGAVGVLRTTERDASASPLLYTGTGLSFGAGYAYANPSWRAELQADANHYGVSAAQQPQLPARADLFRLGIQANYLHALEALHLGRVRPLLGVAVMGSAADRNEQLVNGENRLYRNYIVSLGAALRGETPVTSTGMLSYQLALPLFSGITHPAADVRVLDDPGTRRMHWRGPSSYRQAEQRVSYSHAFASRAGLRTTLMSDLFADADDPQRAGARTALSVALLIWLGPAAVAR